MRTGLPALIAAILLLTACSAVTQENYGRIESGMSREQVYQIIGEPDEVSGGGFDQIQFAAETWRGRDRSIHIVFGGDVVAFKSIRLGRTEPRP